MHDIILIAVVMLFGIGLQIAAMACTLRWYRIVPPGKFGVRIGGGDPKAISYTGIWVVPGMHRFHLVHAEVESLDGNEGRIVVQLQIEKGQILKAFQAFAEKQGDELRQQLQEIVDSAEGDESLVSAKLAEVGYRVI
jgi:hypothetical protein